MPLHENLCKNFQSHINWANFQLTFLRCHGYGPRKRRKTVHPESTPPWFWYNHYELRWHSFGNVTYVLSLSLWFGMSALPAFRSHCISSECIPNSRTTANDYDTITIIESRITSIFNIEASGCRRRTCWQEHSLATNKIVWFISKSMENTGNIITTISAKGIRHRRIDSGGKNHRQDKRQNILIIIIYESVRSMHWHRPKCFRAARNFFFVFPCDCSVAIARHPFALVISPVRHLWTDIWCWQ